MDDDRVLVLWDIDRTLTVSHGVGTDAYSAAVELTLEQPWRGDLTFNGLTERAMAIRILRMHGVEPEDALLARFLVNIEAALHERADALRERGSAMPGAAAALRAFAADPSLRQSVLTGNLRSVAEMKLRVFDLDGWVDFEIGAYGDSETERAALVPLAWQRVREVRGEAYSPARTVLIGDTVRDVEAALTHGAGIVAVASGHTGAEELRAAGARVVLADLVDTPGVRAAVRRAAEHAAEAGQGAAAS
jgi:phosphoglycolate phosphatase-like HAD superfamily hydrolase